MSINTLHKGDDDDNDSSNNNNNNNIDAFLVSNDLKDKRYVCAVERY